MKIGEFLQAKMAEMGMTQAELARRSGIPASTISSLIIRNNSRVDIEALVSICSALDCDLNEYLNEIQGEPLPTVPTLFAKKYQSLDSYGKSVVDTVLELEYQRCADEIDKPRANIISLPKSTLKASAGTGDWLDDEGYERIDVTDTVEARKATLIIEVDGDSMLPEYANGDLVLVNTEIIPEPGDIGIFVVNGDGYIKQLGDGELISINPEWDNITIDTDDKVRAVGVVIGKADAIK